MKNNHFLTHSKPAFYRDIKYVIDKELLIQSRVIGW